MYLHISPFGGLFGAMGSLKPTWDFVSTGALDITKRMDV